MSENVRGCRVRVAYDRNDVQCEILVYALHSVGCTVENTDWHMIKELPKTEYMSSVNLSLRAAELHDSLLKLADKDLHQAQGILQSIINMTYEGEKQEMDNLPPDELTEDFSLERFKQFYYDTLLFKREAVREYCRKNEIRQVREVPGLMFENAPVQSQPAPDAVRHGGWISGADVMRMHGKLAVEIGQACHDGKLNAFTGALTPVLEETKLAHIPKYPPTGTNPLDHIQYTHSPKWDWTEQITVESAESLERKKWLAELEALRDLGDQDAKQLLDSLEVALSRGSLKAPPKEALLDVKKINQEALALATGMKLGRYGKEYMNVVNIPERVALQFMETAFNYHSNDIDGQFRTFCFRIKDFTEQLNNDPIYALSYLEREPERFRAHVLYNKPLAVIEDALSTYETHIKAMLFKRSEVGAWVNSPTAGQGSNSSNGGRGEAVAQTQTPDEPDTDVSTPSENIQAWRGYRGTLPVSITRERRRHNAAHIAELKFMGKSQKDIFNIVFPNETAALAGTKRKRISGYKSTIEEIARKNNLPMPPW